MQRRKARLQTHGPGREDYEFEVLPNEGDEIRPGELYDAFAGGEEYMNGKANGTGEDERRRRRGSGEEIGDHEMGGFLADSETEDEEDDGEEKGKQRLLREGDRS
jgi:hypothetical protein